MLFNTILSAAIARELRDPNYQGWESVLRKLKVGLS